MVIGDLGVIGALVTREQAENTNTDIAIIQQPKMEVPPAQDHHRSMKNVSSKTL